MITKSLRLSDSMVSAIREIGRAEQIEEWSRLSNGDAGNDGHLPSLSFTHQLA